MGGCPSKFDASMLSFENHSTGTTGTVFCILMHAIDLHAVWSLEQLDYCLKWYAMRVDDYINFLNQCCAHQPTKGYKEIRYYRLTRMFPTANVLIPKLLL